MELEYKNINDLKWERILRENCRIWQSPLTVELPVHPCHSTDWIMVDSSLDVGRLRVFPELSKEDAEKRKNRYKNEVMLVQFAFDDPPFVPDCRYTSIKLAEGRYPVAEASYFAWDMHYQLEYLCQPIDERQNLLWINVTVTNEDNSPRNACVRTKISFLPEGEAFDFLYVPFYRDAGKYHPSQRTRIGGDKIILDGKQVGRVLNGEFNFNWEDTKDFNDEDYNKRFNAASPYFVTPCMRYKQVRQTICCSSEIGAGKSLSFSIVLFTDYESVKDSHIKEMSSSTPKEGRQAAIAHFKSEEKKDTTVMQFPASRWNDILSRMQTTVKQMLVHPLGKDYLIPLQGGADARHEICMWEAMVMLQPMLKLGYFSLVRDSLSFIFKLQDSEYPPKGNFTTTKGAIGCIGTPWICTTGSVLALAADYYRYSHDEEFLKKYLPSMLNAADWIIGELKATRKLNKDGSRPVGYGLMPSGMATDGDTGRLVVKTDNFTLWGLKKFSALLCELRHQRAEEINKETELYTKDILRAVEHITRSDGFIERKISVKGEKIHSKFDYVSGSQQLFFTGVLDTDYERMADFVKYWENNIADGPFMGKMDREVVYIGNSEYYWHDIYLKLGEWKKAFLAFQTYMKYGMTEETFIIQERFSKRNPAYTPYQPNGSGCGRLIDMMLKSFYFEHKEEVVLLAGIPFAWLKDNVKTALKGLYVARGRVSLEASMQKGDKCRLILSTDNPSAMPRKIKIPEFFVVESVSDGVRWEKNIFILPACMISVEFIISDANI